MGATANQIKTKILIALIIVTSLLGYLEWSVNQHMFLLEMEAEIFVKLFNDPSSVLHPFIILPLFSQIILLIALFQNKPRKWLIYIGIGGIGLLMVFIFFIGCLSGKMKILFSAVPFLVVSAITIWHIVKSHAKNNV